MIMTIIFLKAGVAHEIFGAVGRCLCVVDALSKASRGSCEVFVGQCWRGAPTADGTQGFIVVVPVLQNDINDA